MCTCHTDHVFAYAGVIWKEAEERVGTAAKLDAAVKRGAVLEVEEDGELMYYFRRNVVGSEERITQGQTMTRQKHTTDKAFEATKDMVVRLGWSLKSKRHQLEATIVERY